MKRLLAACAALALAGCATPTGVESRAAPPGRDCFHADAVNGYEYVDEHSVAVRVGANRALYLEHRVERARSKLGACDRHTLHHVMDLHWRRARRRDHRRRTTPPLSYQLDSTRSRSIAPAAWEPLTMSATLSAISLKARKPSP